MLTIEMSYIDLGATQVFFFFSLFLIDIIINVSCIVKDNAELNGNSSLSKPVNERLLNMFYLMLEV